MTAQISRQSPSVSLGASTQQLAAAIQRLNKGKLNATLSVTLTANSATTTIVDARLSSTSVVLLMPTTSNAAAAQYSSPYVLPTTLNNGTWTFTHANNGQTDRTFAAIVIG